MTQPGIAPRFPGPVANTLNILPIIYIKPLPILRNGIQLPGGTSVGSGRVWLGGWIISFSLRGLSPRLLPPFEGGVDHLAPEAPLIRGMPTGP